MKKVAAILSGFFLVIIPLFPFSAQAQSGATTASIVGSIADEQGGLVADAAIRVKEISTNLTREAVSGADGSYLITQLPPDRCESDVHSQKNDRFIAPPNDYRAAFAPRQLQFGFRFTF